jgi:hypothetical protein
MEVQKTIPQITFLGVYHDIARLKLAHAGPTQEIIKEFLPVLTSPKTLIISEDPFGILMDMHSCRCGSEKVLEESKIHVLSRIFDCEDSLFTKIRANIVIADRRKLPGSPQLPYLNTCRQIITSGAFSIKDVPKFLANAEFKKQPLVELKKMEENDDIVVDRGLVREFFQQVNGFSSENYEEYSNFLDAVLLEPCNNDLVNALSCHVECDCGSHDYDHILVIAGAAHTVTIQKKELVKYPVSFHDYAGAILDKNGRIIGFEKISIDFTKMNQDQFSLNALLKMHEVIFNFIFK